MIEVIKFRDFIPIRAITKYVPGTETPTLEVLGEDFSSVDSVLVNEVLAPEFIIINKTTMWVVLPDAAFKSIDSIEVLSNKFTKTSSGSKISFSFGTAPRSISGILRLIQLFIKLLLTTPGTDIFNPLLGGGLQNLVGSIATSRNMEPVITAIMQSINNTTDQMRTIQARAPGLAASERLMSADLLDYGLIETRMEAVTRIKVTSYSGEAAVSNLSL